MTGIEKGVQFLSNANAIAAVLLVFFLFVVGPTVFILSTFTESLGGYLTHLPTMAFRTGAFGNSEFLNTWTIFYWAWWISWTPFVGMFIARISKGRTIRQFVVYVILVPSIVSFVWFSILAGAAFDLQLSGAKDLGAVLAEEGHRERALHHAARVPARERHGGARGLPGGDLLHHRGRLGLDRDGDAQPARQGGADALAGDLLGRRPGRSGRECCSSPAGSGRCRPS